jgi:hypothetical protein
MNESEKKLRMKQDNVLTTQARIALDRGNPSEAVALIEQIINFLPQNLITLMSVITFHSEEVRLVTRATALFHRSIALCTNVNSLLGAALWAKNPNRARVIPQRIKETINQHRRTLEPGWDGVWHDGGIGPANKTLNLLKKDPSEVFDPEDCLTAATQASDWGPWLSRYHGLGGSSDNLRFIKFWVAKTVKGKRPPTYYDKQMLKKFAARGPVPEVRSFLRNITPTRRGLKGKNPNEKMAHFALFLYCECERLEHTIEDWVHIAKSAIHLNQRIVARIVQRVLAEMELPAEAKEVFVELERVHGPLPVTKSAREDLGYQYEPKLRELSARLPAQGSPYSILYAYARQEIDD